MGIENVDHSEQPPLERFGRRMLRIDDLVERLKNHLRAEALDFRSPAWPPTWLKGLAGISAVFLALGFLVPIGGLVGALFNAVGLEVLMQAQASSVLQCLDSTVRDFLDRSSVGLPLSVEELFAIWKISGFVFFLASAFGARGGRVGWVIYGAITSSIVWAEASVGSRWVAAGLVVLAWSTLSIFCLGLSANSDSSDLRKGSGTRRLAKRAENLAETAEKGARKNGYADLSIYFDQQGTESIDRIAKELGIAKSKVSELRSEYLPVWVSPRARMTPGVQKQVITTYREGGFSREQICESYGISLAELRGLIGRYEAVEKT